MARTLDGIRRPENAPVGPVQPQPVPARPQKPVAQPVAATKTTKSVVAGPSKFRQFATVLVLSLALAIIIIDTTLLNVALAPIIRDLHTNIQSLQWVITAYALTLAALTITGGRLGDLYGRKRLFIGGAIIFAGGSFLASISQHLGTLLIGESLIEGVGAALMMPATASLLIANFTGRARALAFGVWGGVAAAASAIGPLLGGYLTTHYSWRWGFRINVGVAALLVLGSLLIRDSRDEVEKPELDLVGVFLSASGLLAIVFGIIESATYGWFHAKQAFAIFGHSLGDQISVSFWALAVGVVLLVAFALSQWRRERRGHTPLVSMAIFRNRQFTTGALTTMIMSLSMVGLIFVVPVFLQSVRSLDALHTGLALLPMSATMLLVGPFSAWVSHYIRVKYLIMAGLLINVTAALVLMSRLSIDATSAHLAPALVIYGVGMGLVMAQISNLTLSAVSPQQAGEASGVNNTLRQVGSSLGTAIIGAVLIAELSTRVISGINASSVIPEPLKPKISAAAAASSSSVAFGGVAPGNSQLPPAVQAELTRIGHQAVVDGAKKALDFGALFAGIGFLVSILLPAHRDLEKGQAGVGGH